MYHTCTSSTGNTAVTAAADEKIGGIQFVPVVRFLLETLIEIIEFSEGTNETERDSVVQTSLQLLETNPVIKSSIVWIFYRLLNFIRRK